MTYFRVRDLDKAVASVTATGGSICVPATDTPVGPFSVVNDPQGAVFTLIEFRQDS
jgi:predicted enzyme related to lactoylglutathione lyase